MREPGASEVLMCGCTFRPASTAFFASRPAASITLGFEVLVHEVIAAISTSPLPIVMSPAVGCSELAADWAAASVGLFESISTTSSGAPGLTDGVFGTGTSSTRTSLPRARWRVSRLRGRLVEAVLGRRLAEQRGELLFTLPISMRSCGRFGPARLGVDGAEVEADDPGVVDLPGERHAEHVLGLEVRLQRLDLVGRAAGALK